MRRLTVWVVMVGLLASGCGMRTVYVPDGTPVRLAQTVHGVKVWVKDPSGRLIATRMDLPEGWYALPVDDENP